MDKIWQQRHQGNLADIDHIAEVLGISKSLSNLLVQKGIRTFEQARRFFRPKLTDLYDPFLMKDMQIAIERLQKALNEKEKIMIYGDYDVDGTTSVALLFSFLSTIYDQLDYYVPDRYAEGYGISYKGIDYAADNGFSLIIALDCGIKAVEKIEYASQQSIDFIICDHHTPGETLPKAVAVLDPKRKDCDYPFKELSGCGVGFKFLQAFCQHNKVDFQNLVPYLDLVAVSIASDIVPIVDENRILAYYGLKQLNESPRTGLKSIMRIAGMDDKTTLVSDCVFKIGPRINAAGRIKSARKAVELLVAEDEDIAVEVGKKIDEFNTERKDLDHQITGEALSMIENNEEMLNRKTTVLYKPDWNKGVIGIVASRLIESYYRPTVILTQSHGMATGSARSVYGFNLYNAVEACSHLLEGFGGHIYAAGLTMKTENIPEFAGCFEKYVSQHITPEQLIPHIEVDTVLNFHEITPKFYRILKQFAPFGPENMTPIFVSEQVRDTGASRIVGTTQEHLKLELIQDGVVMPGIAFSQANRIGIVKSGKPFKVCYSIEENHFRGNTSLQLAIRDIKPQ